MMGSHAGVILGSVLGISAWEGRGRKQDGAVGESGYHVSPRTSMADHAGNSGARLAFQNCLELG